MVGVAVGLLSVAASFMGASAELWQAREIKQIKLNQYLIFYNLRFYTAPRTAGTNHNLIEEHPLPARLAELLAGLRAVTAKAGHFLKYAFSQPGCPILGYSRFLRGLRSLGITRGSPSL